MEDIHNYLVAWRMYDDVELMSESFFSLVEAEAYRRMMINKGRHPEQVRVLAFPSSSPTEKKLMQLHERLHSALDVEDFSEIDEHWDGWKLLSEWSSSIASEVKDSTGKTVGEHLNDFGYDEYHQVLLVNK
ncbi:MAG TPA: hypothetical protein DIS96_01975 [Pusillimonas sp.]|nr:hypothetical protein [Pusillimonas sp.]